MIQFENVYADKEVLVTGHTGFKGSWLVLWLQQMGANITGLALDPCSNPNHWNLLNLEIKEYRVDIRDAKKVKAILADIQPEIVFHLAAQPLVRQSYLDPLDTWSSNVMGTANLLEACRLVDSVKGVVAITTDKVYRNQERLGGYCEEDRLGGHDPYSASKAACELLIDSYRKAYFESQARPLLASARAGNVVGGGDWAEDRLIPDADRSIRQNTPFVIRSPKATRPWQHVLDCLTGYLLLGQKLLQGQKRFAKAWNFGSRLEDNASVLDVLTLLKKTWPSLQWQLNKDEHPHETARLYLNNTKASDELKWMPVWSLEQTLYKTAQWYRCYLETGSILSIEQLYSYIEEAQAAGVQWVSK